MVSLKKSKDQAVKLESEIGEIKKYLDENKDKAQYYEEMNLWTNFR